MSRGAKAAFNLFLRSAQARSLSTAARTYAPVALRQAAKTRPNHALTVASRFLPHVASMSSNAALTHTTNSKASLKAASILLSLAAGIGYAMKLINDATTPPKETPVIMPPIDLSRYTDKNRLIVDLDEFEIVGDKPKGHLSGKMLKHKETGEIYYMKGATSLDALVKEVLFAETMRFIEPKQPKGLLLQDRQPDGQAVFYTLSQVHPGSIDLEDFVEQELYKGDKPLLGMERAIAIDMLFGKQSDMKLQNYVAIPLKAGDTYHGEVVEQDAWGAVCIDHEIALTGIKILTRNKSQTYDDFKAFSNMGCLIRDRVEGNEPNPGQVAPPKLAGDPRVKEFLETALDTDNYDKIDRIYLQLAGEATAFPVLEGMVAILCEHHKHNGNLPHEAHREHLELLRGIQDNACEYVARHGLGVENTDEATSTPTPSPSM